VNNIICYIEKNGLISIDKLMIPKGEINQCIVLEMIIVRELI